MKNIVIKILILVCLFGNTPASGQIFLEGTSLATGLGCDAAEITTTGSEIEFPFPQGITFSQLSQLSTKYLLTSSYTGFLYVEVWVGVFKIRFTYNIPPTQNTWMETGNLLSTYTSIEEGTLSFPIYSYADALQEFGSLPVTKIFLRSFGNIRIDDTRINNILLNYDDCDDDEMLDYYDCDPSVPQGQKMKICHNGNTICVSSTAVPAHESHGDYLGPCGANQGESSIVENPNPGAEESLKPAFSIYPNPAYSHITIQHDKKILGNLVIYGASGKIVYQQFFGNSQTVIDLGRFSSGVYYLRSDQMEKAIKFVKL